VRVKHRVICRTILPRLATITASFLWTLGASAVCAQAVPNISQGTVNIALANAKGIVLLTDSVQTSRGPNGNQYLSAPKLFQLDDKTVCSIAGFASETGWVQRSLNTDIAGIVADFKDQLSRKPVPELRVKLQGLAHLVGLYISLVANRREVLVGPGVPSDTYIFEVIVAGYDADGKPKLEKIVITPVVLSAADGHNYWSITVSSEEVMEVGQKLVPLLGGIKDISNAVLNSPQQFDAAIVRKYAAARARNGGESLTLDEMAELASYMAAQTSKTTPSVGGPDQIAILTKGRISKFEQPSFPDPPRPLHFAVMVGLKVTTDVRLLLPADTHFVWIRSQFIGMQFPGLELGGNFFYGCEVRDSIVSYNGRLTDFGTTNTVVNSMLFPGSSFSPQGQNIYQNFKWRPDPPNPPQRPATIGPI
jgi:hypothetical protein